MLLVELLREEAEKTQKITSGYPNFHF